MPVPPLNYVKLYTDENIKAGRAPRWTFSEIITLFWHISLSRPPPPIADTYSMFGVTINNDDAIIQSLESQVTLKETAQLLGNEIFELH